MTSISSNVSIAAFVRTSLKLDPQESVAILLCKGRSVVATLRVDIANGGQVTQWIDAIHSLVGQIITDNGIDATVLVAYDDRGEFKGRGYSELDNLMMLIGAPIRRAVLVANGQIMDFNGDGTDAVAYSEVEAEPLTLEDRLNGKNPLRAKDIEHCEESSIEVQTIAVARVAEIMKMGDSLEEIAPKIGHEMATQIAIYREAGEVTEEVAGWLTGTFSVKLGRDMAVLALAGTATDKVEIASYLIGDRVVEDRQILEDGHEMLFESLAQIAGSPRPNILCAVAWAHWTRGNSTEAMATLTEVIELEPNHELGNLFMKLIASGKVSKTAMKNPKQ
ncbi:hypothetical protein AARI_30350 [Glutamicibacter arilaitensis Re117]|uniref:DUF4192 domain-containing protein n=1 Tax=Glutamicibacter arilaitensis (strain DSM 16368 / CIP 108037 / IAM 15318 / JCM 13566 / NCIMB 14258 / Re117) TaxID=861360 RepID=A0ABP1U5H4_GLUAR|nr:DUF4192 family protein [Glutamicibacter arilaitensis]CBT77237.1 hypothetical protein AARI_30350 [Glutamicibacter arilaitensis Re117]